ncbi:MAG: GPI anchored serine-threonine rich family protein, partial [Candidatus Uhrbacteria bacterium]|nr:GPI anchored serine-threonine rich family protein [Candidatus Uhrbacteria bacterium]
LTIQSPNGGETYTAGDAVTVSWSTSGSAMAFASLYYTTDGGTTYATIAEDVTNNGSYTWTIPDITSSQVSLYVVGTDLVTNLATDISDAVFAVPSVTTSETDVPEEPNDAPASGILGVSPVTGESEDISLVDVGDVIKSPSFATVYYIDSGLVRRPFIDAQTFFTYEDSFDVIMTVTDATLPTLSLGRPMLPKAGVVLVKITSDDAVYVVVDGEDGTTLRWMTTEDIAVANFGQSWSDFVIDVPPTLFPGFILGDALAEVAFFGVDGMKTRFALSIEDPEGDTDGDGLTNAEEAQLGTTSDDADTDDDGYPDALEVGTGHDPLTAIDSDGDGYPDYLELLHGYDRFNPAPVRLEQ